MKKTLLTRLIRSTVPLGLVVGLASGLGVAAAAEMTDAEVRKVDKAGGKLTLRHGEIKNLDMPPMTMVFRVKDGAVLDRVKAGDKVRFAAEKQNGDYVVTDLQPAP